MSVKRFLRFVDQSDTVQYGEPSASDVRADLEGKSVEVLSGDPYGGFSKTGKQAVIKQVCRLDRLWKQKLTEKATLTHRINTNLRMYRPELRSPRQRSKCEFLFFMQKKRSGSL